jgi:hypothetical protein
VWLSAQCYTEWKEPHEERKSKDPLPERARTRLQLATSCPERDWARRPPQRDGPP